MADNIIRNAFGINPIIDPTVGISKDPNNIEDAFGVKTNNTAPNIAMKSALDINPDQHAKINKLSKDSGIPQKVVEANPDKIANDLKLDEIKGISSRSPITSKFISNRDNAIVAQNDVQQLSKLEHTFLGDLSTSFDKGQNTVEAANLGLQDMFSAINMGDPLNDVQFARQQELTRLMQVDPASTYGAFLSPIVKSAEQLPIIGSVLLAGAEAGASGIVTGATVAAVAGLVIPAPEEILTVPAAALAFGIPAAKLGVAAASFNLEAGLAFSEFKAFKDSNGRVIDPEVAGYAAAAVGGINAVLEFASLRFLGRTVTPGLRSVIRNRVKGMLGKSTTRQIILNAGKAYAAGALGEALTEGAQEFYTVLGGEFAKLADKESFTEQDLNSIFDKITSAESGDRFIESIKTGLEVAAVFSTPGTVFSVVAQKNEQLRLATIEQLRLDKIQEIVKETELHKRDNESFKQFVGDVAPDDNVYIDGTQTSLYLQSKTTDEIKADQGLTLLNEQAQEAAQLGGDVVVPVSDFAATIAGAGSEHFDALRPHMTMSAKTTSPFRQEQTKTETKNYIKGLVEEAETTASEFVEAQDIFEQVRSQLVDSGTVTPQNATTMAQIVPAWATVYAKKNGITVTEAYQRSELSIIGAHTGKATEITGETSQVVTPEDFHAALIKGLADNKNAASVTEPDIKNFQVEGSQQFLFDDGKAGYAIDKDGTLTSVFKAPDSTLKKVLDLIVPQAIANGATKLDAFEGFLTKQYSKFGFEEVGRAPFDPALAPPNWDTVKDGTPDVVFMELNKEAKDAAEKTKQKRLQNKRGVSGRTDQISTGNESSKQGQAKGREEDGSLGGLPRVKGAQHNQTVEDVAKSYMESQGLEYTQPSDFIPVDPKFAARVADAYTEMKHDPQNPEVKAAYAQMIKEVTGQYEAAIAAGLKVEFINPKDGDPYADDPRMVIADIRDNNHMWVFSTRDGFGSNDSIDVEGNPLSAPSGIQISGQEALVNDLFRVVHDYFGHVKEGVGFRSNGEDNAWRSHLSMFSPLAQRALTTETRGQNSWVNYGPHGEKNRVAKSEDTIFADQKTGLLPEWVSDTGVTKPLQKDIKGFFDPANSVIRLTEASDLSTFLHEFAHFMYEMEKKAGGETLDSINGWFKRNAKDVAKEANGHLDTTGDLSQSEIKQPWQMTKAEYDSPVTLKEEETFTVRVGSSRIKVILNPTSDDLSLLKKEAIEDFGKPGQGDPALRFTEDVDGNTYYWAAAASIHAHMEPVLSKLVGTDLNQNAGNKPSHRSVVRKALFKGKNVPENVLSDYPGIVEEVKSITGNKVGVLNQSSKKNNSETQGRITEEDVITFLDQTTTGDQAKDEAIQRATHEQFARGFETYVMEGESPSIELRNAFRAFARWLSQIYRKIRGDLNVKLDDDMRVVLDRMLATEEQIAAASARARIEPLFTDAAMAGMTDAEFVDYQKRQEKVKDSQNETLRNKLIKEFTRRTKKWWKDEKADHVDDELTSLSRQKVYVTKDVLKTGEVKLDHATVKDMVGEKKTNKLGRTSTVISPALRGMTEKGGAGVHPDEAAAMLGYKSGSEMMNDIITSPRIKDQAEINAEKTMTDKYGDILNDGTIEKEADEAVLNEERGDLILNELKIISRKTNQAVIDRQTMKQIAKNRIGKLSFRQIQPGKYRKAEINAAKESAVALANGDRELAANAKARQAVNYYMGMEATEARNEALAIVDRMARYNKKKVREEIQKAGNEYWEQIVKILSRFEFRKSATLKSVQDINSWAKERIEIDGDGLVLSPAVLNETNVTHWKNVPFSDLEGIRDSVKNMEYVARYSNKITRDGEEQDFKKLVAGWVGSMNKNATRFTPKRTDVVEGRSWGRWFMAQMTKISYMASWLDGGERVGISHGILVQPFIDAYAKELDMWESIGKVIMDKIQNRNKADLKRHNTKIYIREIDDHLYGQQILSVALNTGNRGNLRKLLLGEGWASPDIEGDISFDNPKLQAVLKHLNKDDWILVQSIWDQMELLYPQLAEVHKKTTGVTPSKVEAVAIENEHGSFRGGYYPLKYDSNRSRRAAANEDKLNAQTESMFSNSASIQASVNTGATNERTGFYAPIRLSLDVVPAHFQETIHYITHHDAVRETNKLISNKEVADTISAKIGPEEYAQLKPWLNDIAKDGREAPTKTFIDSIFARLRLGVTLSIMGFKAFTGIIQISGLSNTAAEVGVGNLYQAMRTILGSTTDIKNAWEFAVENSKVMKHRAKTMDREIKNAMKDLQGSVVIQDNEGIISGVVTKIKQVDNSKILRGIREVSMKHIMMVQTYMVDLPSWHAAYIKSMKELGDEKRAFEYADFVVENIQGSGATHNLSQIMRNQSKIHTTFTMFMTFFSGLWNQERDLVKGAQSGRYSVTTIAAKAMFMFTIPVMFEMLFRGEFGEPEGDDDRLQKLLTSVALAPVQSIPFVRDAANAVVGEFGYNSTPVAAMLEQGLGGISEIIKRGFTDDDITKGQIEGASKLIGASLGVPGTFQTWATGEHLFKVMEEGEDLTFHELFLGPDRK